MLIRHLIINHGVSYCWCWSYQWVLSSVPMDTLRVCTCSVIDKYYMYHIWEW